jgi:hypothetical protein
MANAKQVRRPKKAAADAMVLARPIPQSTSAQIEPAELVLRPHKITRKQSDTASREAASGSPAKVKRFTQPLASAAVTSSKSLGSLSRLRARQLSPMAATIVLAAACGAITGSLATVGVAKFLPLDAVIASTSATTDTDLAQQVARLDAELVALKANVGTLAKAGAIIDNTGSITSASMPPGIIPVVDGWVLRNVNGGSALVEGRPGLIQVMPGDSLPGLGRVETIRRDDGRWVVVTTRGMIVAR